ncbi:hypothetical protein LCGC14_0657300 [marine sediment metagenome]|uniref:Elp3/MiaA/NifB-like radical SAM core domain-containing protein n=1 Tax=marine sediment metagenome TaxID=412755 RepID=A0A0F9QUP6_9ZZZZ
MKSVTEKIKFFRQKGLKSRVRLKEEQLESPTSFWIKRERLFHEIGKELTIILRTKGCSWATSESGGCSMCGYIRDACIEGIHDTQIIKQFDYVLSNKIGEISEDPNNYILKIFNSGSFFDDDEISTNVRRNLYEKIANIKKVKEVVLESRSEYITDEKLLEIREFLDKKYIEVAIGLETVDDYIRNNYINKNAFIDDFKDVLRRCKQHGIGVKAYLLFKPPFLNEQAAVDDCSHSLKELINLKINSISINPMNIQKNTLVEYLWFQGKYKTPWYYSLFKCLKKSINQYDLNSIRILCDPSGAGTKRGIHNCLKRECEQSARKVLNNFVLNQNLDELEENLYECECKKKYQLQKNYF